MYFSRLTIELRGEKMKTAFISILALSSLIVGIGLVIRYGGLLFMALTAVLTLTSKLAVHDWQDDSESINSEQELFD